MSRQNFADVLSEPINAAFSTITATTETVLVPTSMTTIPASEPRPGKVYELVVGGTITTGASGTMIITPRWGLVIGGTTLTASPTQTVVPSITTAPFMYRCYVVIRSVGLSNASTVLCTGKWESGGSTAVASSQTSIAHYGSSTAIDTTTSAGLWVGVTCSVAPSIIPQWHIWRSFN